MHVSLVIKILQAKILKEPDEVEMLRQMLRSC